MRYLSILILSLFLSNLQAQMPVPVKWSQETEQVSDTEYDLIFTATIDEGWNIYSQFVEEGGPIPTGLFFEEGPHFELVGKAKEEGKFKEGMDPVFEINVKKFLNKATFTQRIKVNDSSVPINVEVEYMACDATKCLPPTTEEFSINLNGAANSSAEDAGMEITIDDNQPLIIMDDADLVIPPESGAQSNHPVQWSGELEKLDNGNYRLNVIAKIRDGWYLYSQFIEEDGPIPTEIGFEEKAGYEVVGQPTEAGPERISGFDAIFEINVTKYKKEVTFSQEFKAEEGLERLKGDVYSMACDDSKCLPPSSVSFLIDFTNNKVLVGPKADAFQGEIEVVEDAGTLASIFGMDKPELDNPPGQCGEPEEEIAQSSLWNIFVLGFLGGLVALLTPCVFPMIPLTVSFFTKGKDQTRRKGITKAATYGFFILLIYLLLSVPFHLLESVDSGILNNISTNPWLNIAFFLIFLFFAFSFFGYYELTLPSSWSNKASSAEGIGGVLGIFFMALTLALVSFSCTGPILGSLLAGALTADGGAWQLTTGMGGFGLALALPFALFAAFPGWMNTLPKSGGWLNTVKVVLGFAELALALKFLSNADLVKHWGILKLEPFLALWIIIAIGMGLYLFGKIKFPHDSPIKKLSIGRIILGGASIAFAIYLATGFIPDQRTNSYRPLKLLSGLAPPVCYSWLRPCDCPQDLNCFKDLKEGMAYAKEVNKPVMIDFSGYACVNCRKMEEHVWPENEVYELLKDDYVLISLYVDDRKLLPEDEQIPVEDWTGKKKVLETYGEKWTHLQFSYFNVVAQPYYVLMSPEGELLNKPVGYTPDKIEYANFLECGVDTYINMSK
jgi:thiol:disulfide interchange protein